MEYLGTVGDLADSLGINLDAIPHHILEIAVYRNPRLRVTLGRYDRRMRRQPFGPPVMIGSRILLSPRAVADVDCYRETLGHEIAHAMAPEDGHGSEWRSAAMALGVRSDVYAMAEEAARVGSGRAMKRVVGRCAACGKEILRRRILVKGRTYSHADGGCGGKIEVVQ